MHFRNLALLSSPKLCERYKLVIMHSQNKRGGVALCPELTKCLFQFNPNPRNGHTFIIPYVNSEYMGKLSLSYFGPVVWETMLPEKFKKIPTLEQF